MILGIDVSHWQGNLSWEKVANADIKFMFAKCSEGTDYEDDKYVRNILEARENGIITGAYHFYHPKQSASTQARHFYNLALKAPPDLPPVIDAEVTDGLISAQVHDSIMAFAEKTFQLWGKNPIIYSRDGLMKAWGLVDYFTPELYWKAQYNNVMAGYDCRFWQYTDKFMIPGIPYGIDGNKFIGTEEELLAMTEGVEIPEPTIYTRLEITCNFLRGRSLPVYQDYTKMVIFEKGQVLDIVQPMETIVESEVPFIKVKIPTVECACWVSSNSNYIQMKP